MKSKTDVSHNIPQFDKMILAQINTKIKMLYFDNGRECVNQFLANFMVQHDILHQRTCVYTPQKNGIAERKVCHLPEVACSFSMHVPKCFWTKAVMTAIFLVCLPRFFIFKLL